MDELTLASMVPAIGSVPQAERTFRLNWVANLRSTPSGVPFVSADFVAKQGRRVRVVDVRTAEELVGPLGHVPGADWIPLARVPSLVDRVDKDTPIVIVAAGDERSHDAAAALEKAGMRFVAFMGGGLMSWRDLGYSTSRSPAILEREDVIQVDEPREARTAVEADDVRRHVGDRHAVRWIKLPALLVRGLVSCVDGRDDSGVIGTPGGDAGEMLIALRALEKILHADLSDDQVRTLLARRLDVFGRFYMHTDVAAGNATIAALRADRRFDRALEGVYETLEWRRFLQAPPAELRAALRDHLTAPKHIGCGHLRFAMTKAAEYDLREPLVASLLGAFHERRWEGASELEFVALGGGHTERAVLLIRTAGRLETFSRIPLVSPSVDGAQVFVHHPRVTSYLRKQLARFLAAQLDVCGRIDVEELHIVMERLGAMQLGQTLSALAKDLPIFEVTFEDEDRFEVRAVGHV